MNACQIFRRTIKNIYRKIPQISPLQISCRPPPQTDHFIAKTILIGALKKAPQVSLPPPQLDPLYDTGILQKVPAQRKREREFTILYDDGCNDDGKLMALLMSQQLTIMKIMVPSFFM